MRRKSGTAVCLVMATWIGSAAAADTAGERDSRGHSIQVEVSVPTVSIDARRERSRSTRLPALEYRFDLQADCARPFAPESVAVTVADSQARVERASLTESGGAGRIELTVPADQLGPVATSDGFCRAAEATPAVGNTEEADAGRTHLSIPGTLSASISLRCSDGQNEEMVYVSRPLDVVLECVPAPAAVSSSPGDSE